MSHHDNAHAQPQELKRAQDMWVRFTEMSKLTVTGTAVVLALMALFLL